MSNKNGKDKVYDNDQIISRFLEFSLYFLLIGIPLYLGKDYLSEILIKIVRLLVNNPITVFLPILLFILLNLKLRNSAKKEAERKNLKTPIRPQSWLGNYIVNTGIKEYENNITGFVYAGAAFLVIIVGLRGLGKSMPDFLHFLAGQDGRLDTSFILLALFVEFIMVLSLAFIMFFKPEQTPDKTIKVDETLELNILLKKVLVEINNEKKNSEDADKELELNNLKECINKFLENKK